MRRILFLILIFAMCLSSITAEAAIARTSIEIIVVRVSNYKEFSKAIGSNRKIELLPGNYNPKAYGMSGEIIKSVSNLTITGITNGNKKYIDFNVSDSKSILRFVDCKKVQISNLNIGFSKIKDDNEGVISFDNCSDITVNNCKLFGNGESFSGMLLKNVKKLIFSNSVIDSSSYTPLKINLSENIEFTNCTLKGYTIELDNDLIDIPNKKLSFKNCNLFGKSGIRSTWNGFITVKDSCGYEISLGTECWNEWRLLSAIKYSNRNLYEGNLSYINTFDGNEEIFQDGKFLKLADKLNEQSKGKIILSIDYIVDKEDSYSDNFNDKTKSKKLNINIAESDLSKANVDSMSTSIKLLKPLVNDILMYSWPITIVYRDANNPYTIIAVAEFSNKSFKEYLDSYSDNDLVKYCTIILQDGVNINPEYFFNMKSNHKNESVTKEINDIFVTKVIKTEPDFGQRNSILFTSKSAEGYYYISALESFSGMGDFMHYNTDMIVKTNAVSGEQYIATDDNTYKLLDNSNDTKYNSKYKQVILKELESNVNINKLILGNTTNDVLAFIENKDMDKILSFIFLTTLENDDFDNDYIDPPYFFNYYIGTFDLNKNKVTGVKNVKLVDFEKCFSRGDNQ